ncbi:MAG TPA: DUF2284 domain-containing protein [Candidatus Lokiarchaeia archaeon]
MEQKQIPEIEKEFSKISYKWRRVMPKRKDRPPSPIKSEADEDVFKELLNRSNTIIENVIVKSKSKSLGHAKLITTDKIVIDPRVRWKCRIPICFGYGMNLNCPPYSPTAEEMTEIVDCYEYAILISFYPPVKNHVFPGFLTRGHGDVNLLNQMVSEIEAEATYLGYYLAMGFKGGPCIGCGFLSPEYISELMKGKKSVPCPALDGQMCPQYLRARPALEACGVDVFATVVNCGENAPYVINPEHPKESVPYVGWHGIVLII